MIGTGPMDKGRLGGQLGSCQGYISSQLPTNTHTVDSSRRLILSFADDRNAAFSGANGWENVCHLMTQEPWFLQEQYKANTVRHLEDTVSSKQDEKFIMKSSEQVILCKGEKS